MIKKFHIDELNRFEFHTLFSDNDNKTIEISQGLGNLPIQLIVKSIRLSVLKSTLLGSIRAFVYNKKDIVNMTIASEGSLEIYDNCEGQAFNMSAVISKDNEGNLELYAYVPSFNIWIKMREYMPYDLIDFLTEFEE